MEGCDHQPTRRRDVRRLVATVFARRIGRGSTGARTLVGGRVRSLPASAGSDHRRAFVGDLARGGDAGCASGPHGRVGRCVPEGPPAQGSSAARSRRSPRSCASATGALRDDLLDAGFAGGRGGDAHHPRQPDGLVPGRPGPAHPGRHRRGGGAGVPSGLGGLQALGSHPGTRPHRWRGASGRCAGGADPAAPHPGCLRHAAHPIPHDGGALRAPARPAPGACPAPALRDPRRRLRSRLPLRGSAAIAAGPDGPGRGGGLCRQPLQASRAGSASGVRGRAPGSAAAADRPALPARSAGGPGVGVRHRRAPGGGKSSGTPCGCGGSTRAAGMFWWRS